MTESGGNKFDLFDDPFKYYNRMIDDIRNASESIYLETYRFMNDPIGIRFRNELTKKAKQGLKIKLLLDSWGTSLPKSFFDELLQYGGELRYFSRLKFAFDFFTKNHKRNHRKLLIIDEHVSYIGSANISDYSLNWREMVLRIQGKLSSIIVQSFFESYQNYKRRVFAPADHPGVLKYLDYEIVQDVPSILRQQIKSKFEQLIRSAEKSIYIETPYFLPGFRLRKELMDAGARGVDVKVIIPKHSDVRLIDILRSRYAGFLHLNKVNIHFYLPGNLHAKCMLIDEKIFAIGSANFDYRSFRYLHEVVLCGHNSKLVKQLIDHFNESLLDSEAFDYNKWLRRPLLQKWVESLLLPFRHLL